MARLEAIGWRPELADALAASGEGLAAARVILAERGAYRVSDGEAEAGAVIPGRLRHRAARGELPVVGDWVAVRDGTIAAVLPRRTVLARRDPDGARAQVLVANVDTALVVMGLDGDFNLRRLERYLAMVGAAGVRAAVVLSKADLHPPGPRLAEVAEAAPGAPVVACDLRADVGPVAGLLPPRETAVLLGSSGAGKSTLLNALMGAPVQKTAPVRTHDSRGRHTTTRRQLFRLPGGALLIDTPGLRAIDASQLAPGETPARRR
ncbi:MAG TPA: GTPase RsgA [Kofleriaceae bacterium]|nr:GTPase RsgA [Kofleriaceae bacterium]